MATATEQATIATPEVRQTKILINGEWRDAVSGKTFQTINPATEELIAEVAEGDEADIDLAVKAARKAFESGPWSTMDARDRGQLMHRLADLIEENFDELSALETLDNGKPIADARAADLPLVIDCLRYYAGWADKIQGDTIPIRGNYLCYTRREPLGVCGQIIPWNFPMLMTAWKWGPALAAGCASFGCRLHNRHEAGRTDSINLSSHGRTGNGSRFPARSHQYRAGLRTDCRCGPRQTSGRRQDRLYR